MSLLNNSNKKGKKKDGPQQRNNAGGFPAPKGKTNTKGVSKQTKLTGGSQRGS